jgi:predicted permease
MSIFWFEFMLSLRRLARRRVQNGLLLVTFTVSVALSLLSWSLFSTVHLTQPDYDPKGEYYVLTYEGVPAVGSSQSTQEEMETYKAAQTVFADFAELAFYASPVVKTPGGYERLLAGYMSSRALQVVGARPLLGRLFTPADDAFKAPAMVLLSEKMWTNTYARDPDIVGRTIEYGGDPATVVGVLPASFRFPNDQDFWISYGAAYNHPRYPVRAALVKLKPGVTRARAAGDLRAIQSAMPADSPSRVRGARVALVNFRDIFLLPEIRVSALILFALSLLFVAVSCANAANLMLIDFLGRRSEVAAGLALGIPRGAAIRGVCLQVGLIALAAALVSLAVLPLAGPLLFERIKIINAPYWLAYHFTGRDVAVAFALTGLSAAVTVIAPIVYLLLVDPDQVIRDHAYASRGTGRALWRRLLLTGQIALLTVLGVSAGLLVRSNRNVGEARWGYDAAHVFNGKISVDAINYGNVKWSVPRLASLRQAFQPIRLRPETAGAAYADNAPGYSNGPYCTYATDAAALTNGLATGEAFYMQISDQYFKTLGVPMIAGEDFPGELPDEAPPYAIVTESLARRLWPDGSALQRTLFARYPWMKAGEPPAALIVRAVVRDFQACGPRAKTNDAIFSPFVKNNGTGTTVHLYVRDQSGMPTVKSLADAVHRGEPRAALYFPSTIKRQIDLMLSSMRMTSDLTTLFAAAAVLLCAIGVYSLTVAQVLQSSREFGIRMALGAESTRLWRDFTRGHLLTALIGVALGLVGATQVVRVLGALLYGVDPYSVATYAGVALAILAVAALACVPSLFRLKRINPAECLRSL